MTKPGSTLRGWQRNAFRVAKAVVDGNVDEAQREARSVLFKLAEEAQRHADEHQREIDPLAARQRPRI